MSDSNQTDSGAHESAETSGWQKVIEELLPFAIVHAEEYKTQFGLAEFHEVHLALIERGMQLIGDNGIRPYWRLGDRTDEDSDKDRA